MRVKSIVIDGFKSYAHRKELADLSPHFNAITGLNGSGKSNIFDAICFVMGITNLKKVRAEDPRELIFRAGTTGVHAARVTIEFINDDPATAPPGYSCEDYPVITVGRQIKLGGKQQFFFNNTVSMQSKVKRFFESISLNVDNPHFMVLQGTVHKLIGMRSQDILSLVEEAVGTKAFDHRRRTAETLIRNKEKKIEEIDTNIETQIGPMLEAMRADQEEYRRLLQLSEGLETKRKFRVAFDYFTKSSELDTVQESLETKKGSIATAKAQQVDLPQQEDELTRRSIRLQDSLGAPSEAANALREQEDDLKKQQSRQQTQLAVCQKQLKQLEHTLRALQQDKEKQRKGQEAFQGRREAHEALMQNLKDARDKVAKLKQAIQLVQSGVQAGASGVSLAEERAIIERDLLHQATLIRRCQENIDDLTSQLQRLQRQRAQQTTQLEQLQSAVDASSVTYERAALKYAPLEAKEARKTALEGEIAEAKRAFHAAYDQFQRESHAGARSFDVDYDRRACAAGIEKKVFGRVGELVMPKEARFATALMIGAQQQLLRVVVETDAVAEDIIKHGLRQRTAFMALNKLFQPRRIESGKVQEAQRIATAMGESVHVARDLTHVKEDRFHQLADFVYSGFFVCSSLKLAQELAYNPAVRVKAVTVDGEVAEPSGLMSGGSMNQLRDVFGELKAYQSRKAPITAAQQRIDSLEREYYSLKRELEQHAEVIRSFRAAEEGLAVAKQRLDVAQGNSKSVMTDVEEQLRQQKETLHAAEKQTEVLLARRAQIDAEDAIDPDSARKELQKQLTEAEKQLVKLTKEEEKGTAEFERLEADTEQQAIDLANKQREAEEELAQQQSEKANVMAQLDETKKVLADVQERIQRVEEQRQRLEKEIEETQEELSRITEKKMNLDNLVKNAEVDMRELQKQLEELRRFTREEERRHSWIAQEKASFGSSEGPFYFSDTSRTAATLQELREAEAQSAVMSKRMNKKASVLYEDRKKEFDELVSQRAALGEDKEAIQACILGIEDKKWHALDRMVTVVSSIFGKLFSTCLPGASAELSEERNEHGHLSGVGVRVCFNGKEKQSLSELSGGQRSLLALCLILAILRVRPAPIYILDEVDAALDPSHTQNIGRMLQIYFPKSQFLLVSLKDGMFNNANVLYQVRNTQGYSEVFRMENKVEVHA